LNPLIAYTDVPPSASKVEKSRKNRLRNKCPNGVQKLFCAVFVRFDAAWFAGGNRAKFTIIETQATLQGFSQSNYGKRFQTPSIFSKTFDRFKNLSRLTDSTKSSEENRLQCALARALQPLGRGNEFDLIDAAFSTY
jgi:hypothetical protein